MFTNGRCPPDVLSHLAAESHKRERLCSPAVGCRDTIHRAETLLPVTRRAPRCLSQPRCQDCFQPRFAQKSRLQGFAPLSSPLQHAFIADDASLATPLGLVPLQGLPAPSLRARLLTAQLLRPERLVAKPLLPLSAPPCLNSSLRLCSARGAVATGCRSLPSQPLRRSLAQVRNPEPAWRLPGASPDRFPKESARLRSPAPCGRFHQLNQGSFGFLDCPASAQPFRRFHRLPKESASTAFQPCRASAASSSVRLAPPLDSRPRGDARLRRLAL